MDYYLFIYFAVGAFEDFLETLTARFIAKEKATQAAFLSFFSTIVSMIVLYTILAFLDSNRTLSAIAVYALGISTGTFLAMKFNPKLRNVFKAARKRKKAKQIEIIPVKETSEKKGQKEVFVS